MIELNTIFEKDKINEKTKESLMLVEIKGIKKIEQNVKKRRLNLSLCIDISGSMGSPLKKIQNLNSQFDQNLTPNQLLELMNRNIHNPDTKMNKAKELAIKAIEKMSDGDIISIVVFDQNAQIIIPTTVLNYKNRETIYSAINSLKVRGMTNLHEGWITSVQEIAKEINPEYLNRVILITDGEITAGISNSDIIAEDVQKINNKNISTTTIGIGEDFNEELLQAISNNGGGNFYYVSTNEDFENTFEEEFTGINQIAASDIKLILNLYNDTEIVDSFNDLEKTTEGYIIKNLSHNMKIPLLFKIKFNSNNKEKFKYFKEEPIGEIIINFINSEGEKCTIISKLNINFVNNEEWEKIPENKEVKVQEILLSIAREKLRSRKALIEGNIDLAKNILNNSYLKANKNNILDDRIIKEEQSLNASLSQVDNNNLREFSKEIFFQSYNTRYGKN